MRSWYAGIALVAFGCAHEAAPGPSSGGIGGQRESSLEGAYGAVRSGARTTARAAGMVVEKVSDSTVRVMREAGQGMSRVAGGVSDAWITTKVKSTLAVDSDASGRRVHVDTDAGVVTLRGRVASEREAVRAIADTLNVNGVVAVNSELGYPSDQADLRSYEK